MQKINSILKGRTNLLFLDFEATQIAHEMIAFGATKVTVAKNGQVKSISKGIKRYVKCTGSIGKVITELTGINKALLTEHGITFTEAMRDLKTYVGKDLKSTVFVCFGNFDMKILHDTSTLHLSADKPFIQHIIKNHFDFGSFINDYVRNDNGQFYNLKKLLEIFNCQFKGQEHDPLADAVALAHLYKAFLTNREIVVKEYQKYITNYKKVPSPIKKVLTLLKEGKTVGPQELKKIIKDEVV